ncbi:MAG: 4'-phosphopantetheinyl transferase superfamily protein [Oscillospiraceae bacterium]|nr:4'-phosphopantetheinyl transferase superfamily protein [Oscillospiraceae bacterium]
MEIKLFFADVKALEDPVLYHRLYRSISASRREKVDQVRLAKGRLQSLGAGALLEASLAELGVSSPLFAEGTNGKPYLSDHKDLFFNLSHSGSKVLCALSDHEVGCDVERVLEAKIQVARRCFNPEEYKTLLRCKDPSLRADLFYQYWTLKESFLKVTGLGFQLPLNSFCIRIEEEKISLRQTVDDRSYSFRKFHSDGYKYAVCSAEQSLDRVRLTERSFYELAELLPAQPGFT